MKTLLVALYPYGGQNFDSWHDHGSGMTYAAAKAAGCDIDFLDMKTCKSDADLRNRIKGYDLISFGLKSSFYDIGMNLAKMAKAQGSKVILGGYHITACPAEIEEDLIDWVFHGESELTFPQFLKDPSSFPRHISGERPQNLDLLPWFDRSIFRDSTENVSWWWLNGKRGRMVSVISSRGCPYKCSFCQPLEDNHFGKRLRRRSVDNLIDELLWLKKELNPECVMIHDDTFFIQNDWIEEFIEKYPQVGLPFWAAARPDGICRNPDLVKRLVNVGWELASIGFESGSQRILNKLEKGTTVAQNYESAKIVHDAGAKIYANYILGIPWETKGDIQATFKMVDAIGAEMPSWSFFTPYPGCGLTEECVANGWSILDRHSYDRNPRGQKMKNVNYEYVQRCWAGFREDIPELLCDIIIPTYENEQLTVDCLNAIKRHTKAGTYRIIWIDNGSKNTSKIDALIKDMDHLAVKFPTNLGFVDAINRGMKLSDAPNVCLLNNDTRVTSRWLEKLMATLYSSPEIGIVGPMTGYKKVGADSHHSLSLHSDLAPLEAREWDIDKLNKYMEDHYPKKTKSISFVAFLCAVMKREVIEKVTKSNPLYKDGLDPNYKMGMWDDNDYNLAIQNLGYKTVLSMDTCIYHRGRSTFDVIQQTEHFDVGQLLVRNKNYLDSKWSKNALSAQETVIVSRAIYNKLGSKAEIGILDEGRLELMQNYFINSLKNQTNKAFNLCMVVGKKDNEATRKIESLDWGSLKVEFIYTDCDISSWEEFSGTLKNSGKESTKGSPEYIVRTCGHPLPSITARLDTDDWVAPGWIAHMKQFSSLTTESHVLLNYQVFGQAPDGRLYILNNPHSRERTSPFIALIQKFEPRISPYAEPHLSMGKRFNTVVTIPPSYAFMVIHEGNRSNKIYDKDKFMEHIVETSVLDRQVVRPSPHVPVSIRKVASMKDRDKIPTRIVHRPNEMSKIQYERFVAQGGMRSIQNK